MPVGAAAQALGLAHRFAAICGQDTFGVQKPDPEILRRTIAAAGGNVATCDHGRGFRTDIRTARAAGIPVIAVDFGYTDRPVSELGPDRIISHFARIAFGRGRAFCRKLTAASRNMVNGVKVKGVPPVAPFGARPYPFRDGRALCVA